MKAIRLLIVPCAALLCQKLSAHLTPIFENLRGVPNPSVAGEPIVAEFFPVRAIASLCLLLLLVGAAPIAQATPVIALRGATLVDLADFGRSTRDVPDSTVLIQGDRIVAAGSAADVAVPDGARVIDVSGKFLVPGLIDAFSVQNNENQARAHLYMGVTTIFTSVRDSRRGASFPVPQGPTLLEFSVVVGHDMRGMSQVETVAQLRAAPALSSAQIESYVDAQRWDDYRAILLYYSLTPEQTAAAARRSRAQKLIAIGEVGHTGVLQAARMGVPVFVHFNRYLLDLAPPALRRAVADDPFGPARTEYMHFLQQLDPASPALRDYAIALAAEPVALMPTLALISLSLPDHANPWKDPVAVLIDPADIMRPADPVTGDAPVHWGRTRELEQANALRLLELQRVLVKHGVKFVLGSGADAFGVLPGLGAHIEMELLVRIGLTPRQALAAGTANLSGLLDFVDYGVIRPGARADLLLLDADPSTDIRHVRRIARLFVRGVEMDRPALLMRVAPTPPD